MATIKDVAKEAGVAVETVSRIMNNRGYISDKTRQKVYDAMKALNYQPNEVARGLSKKNTDTIALVVPHITHPYFAKCISALEHEATKRNLRMILYNTNGDTKSADRILQICQNNFVTGVMLFSADIDPETLKGFNIPIITIERYIEGGTACITVDNRKGGNLAAERLIQKGCKNLVYLGAKRQNNMPGDERESGFVETCSKAGVSCRIFRSSESNFIDMEYRPFIKDVLSSTPDCDGVFATSDIAAAQVIQVVREMGKRVPDDIRVIGFDDTEIATLVSPSITTIHQPVHRIARLVLKEISDARAGKNVEPLSVLPVELIARESG